MPPRTATRLARGGGDQFDAVGPQVLVEAADQMAHDEGRLFLAVGAA